MHDRLGGSDPLLTGGNSKFLSYFGWLQCAHSALPEPSGVSPPLFPCRLPYPEAFGEGVSIVDDSDTVLWAKRHLNVWVAWSNFTVLGCPDCRGTNYEPQVAYQSCEFARQWTDKLLGEVAEFGSIDLVGETLNCSGSRLAVESMFEEASRLSSGYFVVADRGSISGAMAVQADRVAIPECAGTVDPLDFLPPSRKSVVQNLEGLRRPEFLWDDIPVACHRVAQEEEAGLVDRLLQAGMVRLVPEDELPHTKDGKLLCGGLFCVPKNEVEDRLIFDRRPENSTMDRIIWARLPSGACFTRMLLEPTEYLRGSGDDLRNFYYTLKLPDNWVRFNSVGRRVSSHVVRQHGGDPSRHYRMCFQVLGMGDTNACDIAQATHESILQAVGLLSPQTQLIYGEPCPSGDLWEGVYLDDLLIVKKCVAALPVLPGFEPPSAQANDEDLKRVELAEQAYQRAGLKRAEHKAFRACTSFKAWGAEICGIKGRVGAPLEFRRQVWKLMQQVVRLGWCTKRILQKLMGYCCFIFQYRRELFALQHHIYKFIHKMPDRGWKRLPPFICDELRSMAYHFPFSFWNMRKRLSPSLLATDATPTSGGAARALISESVAGELWRQSEVKGEVVRLDGRAVDDLLEWDFPKNPSTLASVLGRALPWHAVSSYSFRQTSHINLQEMRALRREVAEVAKDLQQRGSIQLCLNDSRVVCGAIGKGRSSSFKLNGILCGMLPFLVMADITLALIWIETHANPADHPSRFAPIPPPTMCPKWLQSSLKPKSGVGWEIFAGSTRLTRAHEQLGVKMRYPVEITLGTDALDESIDFDLRRFLVDWIFLAPPCGSFSPLRNLDVGGPLRPKGFPAGDESNPEVALGNLLWRRAIYLANLCHSLGIYFILEHPQNSKAWQLPESQALLCKPGVYSVVTHWCMFDDPEREGLPNRKATRLVATAPWLRDVVQCCDGQHLHGPPLRGKRAKLAGAYPWGFCWKLARACKAWPEWSV